MKENEPNKFKHTHTHTHTFLAESKDKSCGQVMIRGIKVGMQEQY